MPKLSSMRLMMRWEFEKGSVLSRLHSPATDVSDERADGKRFDRMALPRAIDDSRPTFRAGERPRCEGATDVRYRSLYPTSLSRFANVASLLHSLRSRLASRLTIIGPVTCSDRENI